MWKNYWQSTSEGNRWMEALVMDLKPVSKNTKSKDSFQQYHLSVIGLIKRGWKRCTYWRLKGGKAATRICNWIWPWIIDQLRLKICMKRISITYNLRVISVWRRKLVRNPIELRLWWSNLVRRRAHVAAARNTKRWWRWNLPDRWSARVLTINTRNKKQKIKTH